MRPACATLAALRAAGTSRKYGQRQNSVIATDDLAAALAASPHIAGMMVWEPQILTEGQATRWDRAAAEERLANSLACKRNRLLVNAAIANSPTRHDVYISRSEILLAPGPFRPTTSS